MKKMYCIADVNILIESDIDILQGGFSEKFISNGDKPDFTYRISGCDSLPCNLSTDLHDGQYIKASQTENGRCITFLSRESGNEYLQLLSDDSSTAYVYIKNSELSWAANMYYLWSVLALHSFMLRKGALMLHASFIVTDGEALLFVGQSGCGKTTQAELWREYRGTEIINGDRTIVVEKDGTFWAYGLPISGTSKDCSSKSFPVRAVVALFKSEKNEIHRCRSAEAFGNIIKNAVFFKWDNSETELMYDVATELISSVAVISLSCVPDKSAVEILSEELKNV